MDPNQLVEIAVDHLDRNRKLEARDSLTKALAIDPYHVPALVTLSGVAFAERNHEVGAALAVRAAYLDPECGHAFLNAGVSLNALGEMEAALEAFKYSLPRVPHGMRAAVWHNIGIALCKLARFREAVEAFDEAKAHAPLPNHLVVDRAMALLGVGRLQEGMRYWDQGFERRGRSHAWAMQIPDWPPEASLEGKRICIHDEGGYGDTVMLARFLPNLVKMGAQVACGVQKPLVRLFMENFPAVSIFDSAKPHKSWGTHSLAGEIFDYSIPIMGLMEHLPITVENIPSQPYLKAKPWPGMPALPAGPKIGISWASGKHGPFTEARDRRVVPLKLFLPLLERGWNLVSLQKDGGAEDIAELGAQGVIFDPMPESRDFMDTAAIIDQLDYIVSVESGIVHIAGAMGKPVLSLSPINRCWRWWNHDHGLPWYEDIRIFHQPRAGDWATPMSEAIAALPEIRVNH